MKRNNKKALYESIMTSVAKQVKKALNEYLNEFNNNISFNDFLQRIDDNEVYGKRGHDEYSKFIDLLYKAVTIGLFGRNSDKTIKIKDILQNGEDGLYIDLKMGVLPEFDDDAYVTEFDSLGMFYLDEPYQPYEDDEDETYSGINGDAVREIFYKRFNPKFERYIQSFK